MNKKTGKMILSVSLSAILIGGIVYIKHKNNIKTNSLFNKVSESIVTKQEKNNIKDTESNNNADDNNISKIEENEESNLLEEKKSNDTTSNSNKTEVNNKSNVTVKKTNETNKSQKNSNKNNTSTSNKSNTTTTKKKNVTSNNTTKEKSVTSNSNKSEVKAEVSNNNTKIDNNKYKQDEAKKLVDLVNQVRKENGLNEVTWNNSLEDSAKIRASEIVKKFDHTRPNNTKYSTAISIKYNAAGENIACGQLTAKEVFDSWMNSPGHKKNILSPNFKQMSVALYTDNSSEYKYYWVQLFIG